MKSTTYAAYIQTVIANKGAGTEARLNRMALQRNLITMDAFLAAADVIVKAYK